MFSDEALRRLFNFRYGLDVVVVCSTDHVNSFLEGLNFRIVSRHRFPPLIELLSFWNVELVDKHHAIERVGQVLSALEFSDLNSLEHYHAILF